jgi:hypothetical protein
MKAKKEEHTTVYTTRILKFGKKGEKTGWTYIEIPQDVAWKLIPGNKKTFRVKGKLDDHKIEKVAVLPMGDGGFILPLNLSMRKAIGKREGAMIKVALTADATKPPLNKLLLKCLEEDVTAFNYFNSLSNSHKSYFSKYIDSAKTAQTKADRIAKTMNALSAGMDFSAMMRAGKR